MTDQVDFCRIDGDTLARWNLIDAAVAGEQAVKKGGKKYLPMPNAFDLSEANQDRYKQLLFRAVYYNATGRTVDGLTGMAFMKPPVIELPAGLEYLLDDADGSGVGLVQQSQRSVAMNVSLGRLGLLADYPYMTETTSKADLDSGKVRAVIRQYHPRDIINWHVTQVGSQRVLSFVVLHEVDTVRDGFSHIRVERYRVLELKDGFCTISIYEPEKNGYTFNEYHPKDGSGNRLREIPFTFIGSANNDDVIDKSPIYDLAALNMAHFRNSADYEESCFLLSQPTPWFAGLTQEWINANYPDGRVYLGSRAPILLPVAGACGLMQAQANGQAHEAMTAKELMMMRLGAKLIEKESEATATATRSNDKSSHSVLSLSVSNVSEGYEKVIRWCSESMNTPGNIKYEISQDYGSNELTEQQLLAYIQLMQTRGFAKTDLRALLRKGDLIDPDRTDEQIDAELDMEPVPLEPDTTPPSGE